MCGCSRHITLPGNKGRHHMQLPVLYVVSGVQKSVTFSGVEREHCAINLFPALVSNTYPMIGLGELD